MGNNSSKINFVFHNATSVISEGEILSVRLGYNTINIEVSGTASAFTCEVEGKSIDDGSWYSLGSIDVTNFDVSTSISSFGLYQTDLTGLITYRVNLTAITDGYVTVKGRVVD